MPHTGGSYSNGAHTSLVPVGYLYGIVDKVQESLEDPVVTS